jgi:hypothetical protein
MDIKEVRKKVTESNHKDWLSSLSYEFPFCCSSGNIVKVGVSSIYDFVENQIEGFEKIGSNLPADLKISRDFFLALKKEILEFLNQIKHSEQSNLKLRWSRIGISYKNNSTKPLYLFDYQSPETLFLIDINQTIPGAITGAFNFLTGQKVESKKFHLIGAFKAYNISKGSGEEFNRSKGEKISLGLLTKRYEESLDKADEHLVQWLSEASKKTETFGNDITTLKSEKETLFTEWFTKSNEEFLALSKDIDKRKKELEETYGEHLKLKKPAEYWETRAIELGSDGKVYLRWLYILIAIGASSLFLLLWQIPDGMLLNVFNGDANAIKWTIVYVTFISFLAFGIKTLSKLAYSTYHLKRDAEERHKLTLFYLALINESKVDEKDRQLILQSLFSRSDTGLLKDDSSPTMPGVIGSVFDKPN